MCADAPQILQSENRTDVVWVDFYNGYHCVATTAPLVIRNTCIHVRSNIHACTRGPGKGVFLQGNVAVVARPNTHKCESDASKNKI